VPFNVLAVGLRSKASTIKELAEAAERDPRDVEAAVEELVRLGLLRYDNGVITYETPDTTLALSTRAQLDEFRSAMEGRLQSLESFFSWLPALMRQQDDEGADATPEVRVEVYHGPEAVRQVWPIDPRVKGTTIDLVLRDSSKFFVADPVKQAAWHSALLRGGVRVRALGSTVDVANPAAQQRIASELAAGIQARMLPELPSWFWVMGGKTAAIPMTWGEPTPSSVLVVHSEPIAQILTWLFEQMWHRASPVHQPQDGYGWEPLLKLLLNGATVDSASRSLGISARTGRRRLAEAMDHFGVDNLFALGAAWGVDRDS
jgi:hypothetical protein